jgi:hypothetical protein
MRFAIFCVDLVVLLPISFVGLSGLWQRILLQKDVKVAYDVLLDALHVM